MESESIFSGAHEPGAGQEHVIDPSVDQELEEYAETLNFDTEDPNELILGPDGNIKAASFVRLISHITGVEPCRPDMINDIMLTYRAFTDPAKLLVALEKRFFWAQSLPEQKSRTTTQLRVVSVLANWTTRHSHDFLHDIHILEPLLLRFLDRIARDGPEGLARPAETLRRRLSKLRDKPEPALFSMPTPKPILPKSMSQLDFLDLDPEEIARQILLIDFGNFSRIQPWELLDLGWTKRDKESRSPNVLKMISTFNIIATFVSTTILIQEQEARRVQTIAKWIRVSSHLRTWGSLNSIITVFSGLKHSSIYRLKADFAKLKPSDATTFEEISNLCSSARGYVEARKFIKSANPPCIPYLGMLLTDLTFICEGNGRLYQGIINIWRQKLVAEVIKTLQMYQQMPYNFEPVPAIQEMILRPMKVDDEVLYHISVYIQPRDGQQARDRPSELDNLHELLLIPYDAQKVSEDRSSSVNNFGGSQAQRNPPRALESGPSALMQQDGSLRAASLHKIIEYLTSPMQPQDDFLLPLLAAFRMHVTPSEFLTLLLQRFDVKSIDTTGKSDLNQVDPIWLRCLNVLKTWLDRFSDDFSDPQLLDTLSKWTLGFDPSKGTFKKVLQQYLSKIEHVTAMIRTSVESIVLPLALNDPNVSLLEFGVSEVVQELHRMSQILFVNIRVYSLAPGAAPCASLDLFKSFVNNLTLLCHHEIDLHGLNASARVADIAVACRAALNFEAALALSAALQDVDVSSFSIDVASKINQAKALRVTILQNQAPYDLPSTCIPALHWFIKRMEYIPGDNIIQPDLINVQRLKAIGQILNELRLIQLANLASRSNQVADANLTALMKYHLFPNNKKPNN